MTKYWRDNIAILNRVDREIYSQDLKSNYRLNGKMRIILTSLSKCHHALPPRSLKSCRLLKHMGINEPPWILEQEQKKLVRLTCSRSHQASRGKKEECALHLAPLTRAGQDQSQAWLPGKGLHEISHKRGNVEIKGKVPFNKFLRVIFQGNDWI